MGIRSFFSKPLAALAAYQTKKWLENPEKTQTNWMQKLVLEAQNTAFGKDHGFSEIKSYEDFKKHVPVRDYEDLKPYVERVVKGEPDILWKGKPLYLAKTSGTTSGVKYIPISKESIHNHINSAKNAILAYVHETGKADFLDKKLIFLSGSPELDQKAGIFTGRLSGIGVC